MAIEIYAKEYRGESVVIFGCTVFAKGIYVMLKKRGISVTAFVDNDIRKTGEKYLGVDVFLPSQYLLPFDDNKKIIVCSVHEEEMLQTLYKMGYEEKNILFISSQSEIVLDSSDCAEEQMELVREGVDCYRRLQLECGENTVILISPGASGDMFLACAYLNPWRRLYGVERFVLVGVNPNIFDIAELYNLCDRTRLISKEENSSLLTAYMFMGEQLQIKLLSGWVLRGRNSYVASPQSPFLFKEAFKYETYQLKKHIEPEFPKINGQWLNTEFQNIDKGRTIIVAPYGYSSPAPIMPMEIWQEIVDTFLRKGYKVYTVGYGEKEMPIRGTLLIQFCYREACSVLEYAGGFLAARSGLCDIVHMAKCRQMIIYGKNIRNKYISDFFSLKRNYTLFNGEEIIFDDYDKKDLVRCVTDYFREL
jgi:hypothetical protein